MPRRGIQGSRWASLLAGGLFLLSSAAQAQLVRYVASTGNDANPCTSPAAPCRTLQRGINTAPSGGEVKLLSSVDGNATIDRSLTVSGAGFTVTGSIVVNNANAAVVLRDLHQSGAGSHDMGIFVIAASSVDIVRCTVERFVEHGIVSGAPDVELFVTDSIVRDNGGPGITVYDANAGPTDTGSMTLSVDNSRIENNGGDGFLLLGVADATISRTVISGNHASGVNLNFGAASIVLTTASQNGVSGYSFYDGRATLDSCIARGNWRGLDATVGTTRVTVSNSTFTNNLEGIIVNGTAAVRTRGNNTIAGNTIIDVSGTLTALPGT